MIGPNCSPWPTHHQPSLTRGDHPFSGRPRRAKFARLWLRLGLLCGVLFGPSCRGPADDSGPSTELPTVAKQRVIAQGQILPADGIVQLSALPGDVITDIQVAVGDQVQAGQNLLLLQSQQLAGARLNTLRKRREDAARQHEQVIAAAKRQMAGAELKLEQLKSKQAAAQRTAELLDLAKQQVEASKKFCRNYRLFLAMQRLPSLWVSSRSIVSESNLPKPNSIIVVRPKRRSKAKRI